MQRLWTYFVIICSFATTFLMVCVYWPAQLDPAFVVYGQTTGSRQPTPNPPTLPPSLWSVLPAAAAPNTTVTLQVTGENLAGVSDIRFSGTGVTGTVLPGGDAISFSAVITVAAGASIGMRTLSITGPRGTGVFPDRFTVRAARVVTDAQLPPIAIPEVEQDSVRSGYVVVTCYPAGGTRSIYALATLTMGMVHNGSVLSQTTVDPVDVSATSGMVLARHAPDIQRSFGLAIVNTSARNNNITLTILDESGTPVTNSRTFVLGPFMHVARFLSEIFPASASGTSLNGSVVVQSTSPFVSAGLRFAGPNLSTVPVVTWGTRGWPETPLAVNRLGLARVSVFPQFALGGGWASQISIVETGGLATTGQVAFFDSNGQPAAVKMNGETKSVFAYSIPPGGTFLLAPRDARNQTPF